MKNLPYTHCIVVLACEKTCVLGRRADLLQFTEYLETKKYGSAFVLVVPEYQKIIIFANVLRARHFSYRGPCTCAQI